MGKSATLMGRFLTTKEVARLLDDGAVLHEEYTSRVAEPRLSFRNDRVYTLPDGRFLWMVDPEHPSIGRRGNVWEGDAVPAVVRQTEREHENALHGRNSDLGHWAAYTRLGADIATEVGRLVPELSDRVGAALDGSYASLDVVMAYVEASDLDRVIREDYDHLVAYVGEVLRGRVGGGWAVRWGWYGDVGVPYIEAADGRALDPVTVVWQVFTGWLPGDPRRTLRRLATQEVRNTAARPRYFTTKDGRTRRTWPGETDEPEPGAA
jgi:hypothetical protein